MISNIYYTILYEPFYNILVFLAHIVPGADIGISVVILTIFVRLIISPLSHKQIHTQRKMKAMEGEMTLVKKKFENDKNEQTRQIMELYKKHGVNPFSGFLLILIQIPILLALYFVFTRGIPFTTTHLYSFLTLPGQINFEFLGLIDLGAKSITMALLVGVSQYFQISLALPPSAPKKEGDSKNFGEELAKSMNTNMRYVMPVIIAFVTASFPAVVGLYWLTSNLFSIGHELIVRRKAKIISAPTPT
ncbi:MAG TPA: YidC/Oxa1 family membrane protein insertase [Candidatus Paceibacterota bacterium]